MSAMEVDEAASLLARLRSESPALAFTTATLDHGTEEITIDVADKAENVNTAEDDNGTNSTAKTYSVEDYFGVQYDESGQLHIVYACPRPDTQCDGFSFASIQECLDHERDWHDGPYKCFICGQIFASGTRLRRHEHYKDSKLRAKEIEAIETRKTGCRVYHGNELGRRRARTLAKLIKKEDAECQIKHNKDMKKRHREIKAPVKKEMAKKRKKDGPLIVIGTADGVAGADEETRDGITGCEEPCCPCFERYFVNKVVYKRHVASRGHLASVRMGQALLQQLTTMAMAKTSMHEGADVKMSGSSSGSGNSQRESTPPSPPSRSINTQTQLLSPPPTPHGAQHDDDDDDDWDGAERTPIQLELRLAKTQQTLRELRCNAPGCLMYNRQMASSQSYWGHLASEAHVAALKAWSNGGGETVYVGVAV